MSINKINKQLRGNRARLNKYPQKKHVNHIESQAKSTKNDGL